jgi:serine/threonine-protein kinase
VIGVGATLSGRFTLIEELGQGGMGTVYRAADQLLGRNVAIKLLKDSRALEEAEQIRLEAQILARLVHDRIVRLYDFGESDGTYFLVMEEVNGPSFSSRWRTLLLADRLRICGQVAEALDYAHLQGVIHRDVKPGNVLLTPGDEAKLSDFGLSLISGDQSDQSGTIRGTPAYMSPEQAQGKPLDHRSDLYSVGVMLYECATGGVPFVGDPLSVICQHKSAAPLSPRRKNPEIWSTLESLILSLLEKHRSKRPAAGNLVALALLEEAERARRLERINPGLRRSDQVSPVVSPPSRTPTVGSRNGEETPANGRAQGDSGSIGTSATEPPPSALPVGSEPTGPPPSAPAGSPKSFGTSRAAALGSHDHPVAREALAAMLATPSIISPQERYLCGHYLAYLLGGSQRRGIFFRRRLDARNSDRARLLLAMAWLSGLEPTQEEVNRAGVLLDDRPDVRAALSPVVVMKYLASRDTLGKRRRFREIRRRLQEASAYARRAMLNAKGELNPGLMPRTVSDLALIAPPLSTVDAHRVSLWNRVAEVWRQDNDFRQAVLRYATRSDKLDTASADLWPEVVYPLIERAHWQRTLRPLHEAIWDYVVGKLLRVPVAGVRLDRMMIIAVPLEVFEQLNKDLSAFVDEPQIDEEESETSSTEIPVPKERRPIYYGGVIPRDEVQDDDEPPRARPMVPLCPADPFVFTQDKLRSLWEEAMDAQLNRAGTHVPHRTVPVGPYEFSVIPTGGGRSSIRAGSAVRAVLHGMQQRGKQIEMFTPSARASDSGSRTLIAIWIYQDASIAIAYVDFQYKERYILWDAPGARQFNYDYLEELRLRLCAMNLEVPEKLDRTRAKK